MMQDYRCEHCGRDVEISPSKILPHVIPIPVCECQDHITEERDNALMELEETEVDREEHKALLVKEGRLESIINNAANVLEQLDCDGFADGQCPWCFEKIKHLDSCTIARVLNAIEGIRDL